MKYPNITKARFIDRPNRFIAHVDNEGRTETVHVKNTGRCRELLVLGCDVWLTAPGTSGRKTRYDLVAVRKSNGLLVNIDSQAPNKAVMERLSGYGYDRVVPEYVYGNSRIDFYMEKDDERILMEVKGCTLERDGVGYFPDAPTERGVKHIRELIKAVRDGYRAVLAFVIQMEGITEVRPNVDTHPEFGEAWKDALQAGVEIIFYLCRVEADTLVITEKVTLPHFRTF
ncbi:MAG: DNA/RNA nuclease SfsA [Oscillospiraceae bacterium]|nr:DNA/RNA nuclease SfsA [Oscillospiraceae bacterium]